MEYGEVIGSPVECFNCVIKPSFFLNYLTSINIGLCPMAAIPCRAFTSATSTLCSSCEEHHITR